MAIKFQQAALFDAATLGLPLPTVGEQKDIRYFGTIARSILNGPETTGMGFWSINPYIGCAFGCAYCYARYAHRYAVDRNATANPDHEGMQSARDDLAPWLAFERRIFVKQNAADVLRKVLRHGSDRHTTLLQGDSIVIGTATDPFQPAERRFRITRSVLEVLADHPGLTICIITKSPLITRDIDLLRRIDRISKLSLHISLITVDRELARRLEPRAPTPEARLRAIARLRENGLETGINVMPVLPAITDDIEQLEDVVRAVASRGASYVRAAAAGVGAAAVSAVHRAGVSALEQALSRDVRVRRPGERAVQREAQGDDAHAVRPARHPVWLWRAERSGNGGVPSRCVGGGSARARHRLVIQRSASDDETSNITFMIQPANNGYKCGLVIAFGLCSV